MKIKKILAVLLALAMTCCLLPSGMLMFAEEEDDYHYLVIGDSLTNGYGFSEYFLDDGTDYNHGFGRLVEQTYPALIRDKLAEKYPGKNIVLRQFAGSAMRPDEIDALLSESVMLPHVDDDYTTRVFTGNSGWFMGFAKQLDPTVKTAEEARQVLAEAFTAEVEEADLITYFLGGNTFAGFITSYLTSDPPRYGDDDTLRDLLLQVGIDDAKLEESRQMIVDALSEQLTNYASASLQELAAFLYEQTDLTLNEMVALLEEKVQLTVAELFASLGDAIGEAPAEFLEKLVLDGKLTLKNLSKVLNNLKKSDLPLGDLFISLVNYLSANAEDIKQVLLEYTGMTPEEINQFIAENAKLTLRSLLEIVAEDTDLTTGDVAEMLKDEILIYKDDIVALITGSDQELPPEKIEELLEIIEPILKENVGLTLAELGEILGEYSDITLAEIAEMTDGEIQLTLAELAEKICEKSGKTPEYFVELGTKVAELALTALPKLLNKATLGDVVTAISDFAEVKVSDAIEALKAELDIDVDIASFIKEARSLVSVTLKRVRTLLRKYGNRNLQDLADLLLRIPVQLDVEELAALLVEETGLTPEKLIELLKSEFGIDVKELEARYGDLVDLILHAYAGFMIYFYRNMMEIRMLNPDCDLVVIGLHSFIDDLKFDVDGLVLEFGDLYNLLLELANVWMASVVPVGMTMPVTPEGGPEETLELKPYYYADLNSVQIPTFFDELMNGEPSEPIQDYLDELIADAASDYASKLPGIGEIIGSFPLKTLMKLGRLYTLEDNRFVSEFYNTYGTAFPSLERVVKIPGGFCTFEQFEINLESAAAEDFLNDWLTSSGMQFDAYLITLSLVTIYSNAIQEILLDCASDEPMDLQFILDTLANTDMDALMDNIGEELLHCLTSGEELDEATKTLINLYFIVVFPDGMMVGIHPNAEGHQVMADVIWNALENKVDAKTYMDARLPEIFAKIEEKVIDGALVLLENAVFDFIAEMPPEQLAELLTTAFLIASAVDGIQTYLAENPIETWEDALNLVLDLGAEFTALDSYSEIDLMEAASKKQIKHYTALGDSTVFGFGFDGLDFDGDVFKESYGYGHCSPKAYPALLKNRLGIADENFISLAMGSLRVEDIRYILDKNYAGDGYTTGPILENLTKYCESVDEVRAAYEKNIKNSELITISMGSNSFSAFIGKQLDHLYNGDELYDFNWEQYGDTVYPKLNELLKTIYNVIVELNPELSAKEVSVLTESILYGFVGILENFPAVMDDIHALNPEATVALIGLFNPLRDLYLQQEGSVKQIHLGNLITIVMNLVINREFRNYAIANADWCCYVDVAGTELMMDSEEFDISMNLLNGELLNELMVGRSEEIVEGCHESEEGHRYIYHQIVEALNLGVVGDVDNNCEVDVFDAMFVLQYTTGELLTTEVGQELLSAMDPSYWDVDMSGEIDVFDAMYILQYTTGEIAYFPIAE